MRWGKLSHTQGYGMSMYCKKILIGGLAQGDHDPKHTAKGT